MKIKLFLLSLVVFMFSFTDTYAIGSAAKRFNFDIKIAGQYLKRGDFSGCRTRLDKAMVSYSKLDAEDKANVLVRKNKKLMDNMNKTLKTKGFPAKDLSKKAAKSIRRNSSPKTISSTKSGGTSSVAPKKVRISIDRYARCIKNIERYYKEKWLSSALTELSKAEKVYAKIPEQYHNVGSLPENKRKFDDYNKKIKEIEAAENKVRADRTRERETGYAFNAEIQDIEGFLARLKEGKDKSFSGFLDNLSGLVEIFDSKSIKADAFLKKYRTRLEEGKVGNRRSLTGSEIIDIITNRVKYRNVMINMAIDRELNYVIGVQKDAVNDLTTKRMCSSYMLKKLKVADYKMAYDNVKKVIDYCKKTNVPLPKKRFDLINSYKPKLLGLINSAAKKVSFNKSVYSYTNASMKKSAAKAGSVTGLDLIYVGLESGVTWKIHKNAYGIPLYKTAVGAALYHKKGDNYYRAKVAVIRREYNGNGYDPVSSVSLKPKFKIYKK